MRSAARRMCVHLGADDCALVALLDSLTGQQQSETLRRVLVVGFCVDSAAPETPRAEVTNPDHGWRIRFYGRDPLDQQLIERIDANRRDARLTLLAHFARRGYAALYASWPTLGTVSDRVVPDAAPVTSEADQNASRATGADIGFYDQPEANNDNNAEDEKTPPLQDDEPMPAKKSAMIDLMG